MSQPVNTYIRGLFGSTSGADCNVRFQTAGRDSDHPRYVGEALPAHQLVLRGGSERFRAQLDRWTPQALSGEGDASRTAKRPRVGAASRNTVLPELAVPLDSEDELEPTLAAIRFMYTGSLVQREKQQQRAQGRQQGASGGGNNPRSDCSMRALLLIRRQAGYLQVQGCAEACDTALVGWFAEAHNDVLSEEDSDEDSYAGSGKGGPAPLLAPVLELYRCRQLLPSPEEDPRVVPVLSACRARLSRHWWAALPAAAGSSAAGSSAVPQPSKLDLLVWLLGSTDAVRIANNPQLLQRWKALPVRALTELLQSDHLSTDDEGTVVVLVEQWVTAQGSRVTAADKARVRQQLRLVNCSPSYLFDVLPKLPVMGTKAAQQTAFMARCLLTDRSEWDEMASELEKYDTGTPWYGEPRPQSVPDKGLSFEWEISRTDLLAGLKEEGEDVKQVAATFKHTGSSGGSVSSKVTALGYKWGAFLEYQPGAANAEVGLSCRVPAAFGAHRDKVQGAARVSAAVNVLAGGGRTHRFKFYNYHLKYAHAYTHTDLLLLEAPQPAAGQQEGQETAEDADAALLAPWAKLLGPEGKLRGELVFLKP